MVAALIITLDWVPCGMDYLDLDFDLSKGTFKALRVLLSELFYVAYVFTASINLEEYVINL